MIRELFAQFEKTIGGMKFAVVVITTLALGMVAGTLLESYYGTEFANRLVYKNWPFILLQFLMFLSILFAAFRRLPPRKRLYGFYAIHTGLILIGCGSLVTFLAGVDGSLHLPPKTPAREVVLDNDVFLVTLPEEGKQVRYRLPASAFPVSLAAQYPKLDLKLLSYLPYSKRELIFKESAKQGLDSHSSHYRLAGPNVSQDFWLSLNPEARDFQSTMRLGPLNISYLPTPLADCFATPSTSSLIVWHRQRRECFTPEERNIAVKSTTSGKRFLVLQEGDEFYSFFPDTGPWPRDEKGRLRQQAPIRVFSKALFIDKPHLFLFGKRAAWYLKEEKRWEVHPLQPGSAAELPWMGLQLSLLNYEPDRIPRLEPAYTWPRQKDGQLVRGQERAVLVSVQGEKVWVGDTRPVGVTVKGQRINLALTKDSLLLPFEFVLDRFKMEKDPGTDRPASFESFVRVFSDTGPSSHHIFMNNPLKRDGLTFYQASYSRDEAGNYSSTLSVNIDPGRPVKYFGSLLLVLGAIAHYRLNKRGVT